MQPTQAEAANFGLTVEEAGGPPVEIWPDNVQAVNVFIALATQWRVGPAGATGLDYAAVPVAFRMLKVARAQWSQIFEDLRILEDEALATIRSKQ